MTDTLPPRILLATDGSDDAALAARAATDLVKITGSELHVIHAWRIPEMVSAVNLPVEHFERDARRVLDKEVESARSKGVEVAEAHLIRDHPVDAILDLAEELEAVLIVLGSRGVGPVDRLVMGSVSEGVVHHARFPVLIMRGGDRAWPPERIVFADDGSEDARRAGDLAATIGRLFGARGILVRAYPKSPEVDSGWRQPEPQVIDEALSHEEQALEERARGLRRVLGDRLAVRTEDGHASTAILRILEEGAEEESTLVAVGSRGLGTVRRLMLGSVSTEVLRAARGPVLVYAHPHA
jgi:nucleotide-binding universal stress UspA family protein